MKLLFLCFLLLGGWLFMQPKTTPVIYMIGDSTMADKDLSNGNPERGWGHMLPGFLAPEVKVENHAVNGRSSKSFRDEGRWQKVIEKVQPGDYVFIQFGHNDEKVKDTTRYTAPDGAFRENLKCYIRETREKGGIPVLFTPIVRRNFVEGKLEDTHGDYLEAVKIVGRETDVLLIDLNRLTAELLTEMGEEATKGLFMWVEKGKIAKYPEGREDNTHLNVQGARKVAALAVREIEKNIPELAGYVRYYDFVVAKDGSGDFFTVQEAIDAIPVYRNKVTTVYIRKGIYQERLLLPKDKNRVTFIGENAASTVLSSDSHAGTLNCFGEKIGTSGSAGFYIYGNDFTAENLTFENTAGRVGQAVAVLTMGDRIVFRKCRFLGNQDTFYTKQEGTRVYCEECYIEGTVDFIFGKATAVFNRCEICSKGDGYVTAAATPEGQEYGYLFYDCRLTAEPGVKNVYLGRPWREYAQVAFVNCELGKHIRPEGWHNWNKKEAEKTTQYVEINNRGAGVDLAHRVEWMKKKAKRGYTPEIFLAGKDGFNPLAR